MANNKINLSKLSSTLIKLMGSQGLSEGELSRRTEVAQSQINRIKKGQVENPGVESLMRISNYFSISIDQLIGEAAIPCMALHKHSRQHFGWNAVPFLQWAQILDFIENKQSADWAGLPHIAVDISASQIKLFALRMPDTSMEPKFSPNTILIFEHGGYAEDGRFVLINHHNKNIPVLREIFLNGETVYASCINPKFEGYKELGKKDIIVATLVQSRYDFKIVGKEVEKSDTDSFRILEAVK